MSRMTCCREMLIVDDTGTTPFAVALCGTAEFAQAAPDGNEVTGVGLHGEVHFQLEGVRFRKQVGGGSFEGGKAHKFHTTQTAPLRSLSSRRWTRNGNCSTTHGPSAEP